MGRPSEYTEERGAAVCELIAQGYRIRQIAEIDGMPCMKTVFTWLGRHPQFAQQYARAKEEQQEVDAERIIEIADNASLDSPAAVNKARLQVDTRKWLMSKLAPKKYGDKVTTEQTGSMTVTINKDDAKVL